MKRNSRTMLTILGLALLPASAYAHGGDTSTDTALHWSITGPQGPAGAAGATGPAGPPGPAGTPAPGGGGIRLLDADGNSVGLVVGFNNNSISLLSEDGGLHYTANTDDRRMDSTGVLYHQTPDCTGQAYYPAYGVVATLLGLNGSDTAVRIPPTTNAVITINSYYFYSVTGGKCEVLEEGRSFDHPMEPIEFIYASTLPFPHPIRFPVRFHVGAEPPLPKL